MSPYDMALAMCQLALAGVQSQQDRPLTREQISRQVSEILEMPTFRSSVDLDVLVARLEAIFTVWSNDPRALGSDDDHAPWLAAKRGEIEWRFWNRYKLFLLQQQGLEAAAVTNVEKVVDEVLGRLEDPARPGPWDRRGLVMGNVQSGKTGAYAGLLCKAADAGYKVFIVLAGMHNNLRSQTQIRLDEGFLGYRAVPPGEGGGGFAPVGVHYFGPGLKADSVTNRDENGDFRRAIAKHFAIHPGGNPLLFVVKKNTTVLTYLLAWIHHFADAADPATKRRYHRDVPILVIDDESDQASIDTKEIAKDENGNPDPEHDPTKINKLIRQLLFSFDKSAYVGFTATPFANILIHEGARTNECGEDLFPRSFIVNLPAPSNYIGAARIFGVEEDSEAGLEPVSALPLTRPVDDHAASLKPDETDGWMPPRLIQRTQHTPLIGGRRGVPLSLRRAILSFVLSCAVRSIRETAPLMNSMLVHVVRYTRVQEIVREEIDEELRAIVHRLTYGDGNRAPTIVDELREIWDDDYLPTSAALVPRYVLPDWTEVRTLLSRIAQSIEVKSINGSARDALEYEQHRETGLNVIAVGGDKLSRGLTLEGLTISYFLRASRMYDTLMQMGRWFGYREQYIDICRLYTTADLSGWFRHIAAASEELKQEFDYMVSIGATPRHYGLKVRSHPVLLVTSQVKMRHGTRMQLSYSGDISETVVFDLGKTRGNLEALVRLLRTLGRRSKGEREGGYLWRDITPETVLAFLAEYDAASAPRANPTLWTRYIKRQLEQGELVSWSVFLASSSLGSATRLDERLEGIEVGAIKRKKNVTTVDRHTIGRLLNPSDEAFDLDETERQRASERTRELWELDTRKKKAKDPPTMASGRGVRFARPKTRGLLLLYPLDSASIEERFRPAEPLIGVAISFPESETAQNISYVVTGKYAEDADFGDI